jgi:hypothetical protein
MKQKQVRRQSGSHWLQAALFFRPRCNARMKKRVNLSQGDLDLRVRLQKNDELEEDVSCDSAYMLEAMRHVGIYMRAAFHWVP